jgi:hypothetical protein
VVFSAADLARINTPHAHGNGMELTATTLTLTGVEGGVAHFDLEMAMTMKAGPGAMTMKLTGAARVDVASGHLLELGGTGPVGGEMGAPVKGTATMKTAEAF